MYNKNRRYGEDRGDSFAPVNVGDELELKIEAVGEKGDGIAKIKGFVIFVPNAKQGETVKVRITKVLRKVGFGEIVGQSKSENHDESQEVGEMEEMQSEEQSSDEKSSDESQDSEDFGEEA